MRRALVAFCLLISRLFYERVVYPIAHWWEASLLPQWEELVRAIIRQVFAEIQRFLNGFVSFLLQLFNYNFRDKLRKTWDGSSAWQKTWERGIEKPSTLNFLVAAMHPSKPVHPTKTAPVQFSGDSPDEIGDSAEPLLKPGPQASWLQRVLWTVMRIIRQPVTPSGKGSSRIVRRSYSSPNVSGLADGAQNGSQPNISLAQRNPSSGGCLRVEGKQRFGASVERLDMFVQQSGMGIDDRRRGLLEDAKISLELAVVHCFGSVRAFIRRTFLLTTQRATQQPAVTERPGGGRPASGSGPAGGGKASVAGLSLGLAAHARSAAFALTPLWRSRPPSATATPSLSSVSRAPSGRSAAIEGASEMCKESVEDVSGADSECQKPARLQHNLLRSRSAHVCMDDIVGGLSHSSGGVTPGLTPNSVVGSGGRHGGGLHSIRRTHSSGNMESLLRKTGGPQSASDVIRQAGYPLEVHSVTTQDGYILSMERIPRPGAKDVVFFMHGVLDTSLGWISAGVTGSQAFAAWDAGFDVWLGNTRSNPPCLHQDPKVQSGVGYWRFSVNDIGMADVGSQLDRIHDVKCNELGAGQVSIDLTSRMGPLANSIFNIQHCASHNSAPPTHLHTSASSNTSASAACSPGYPRQLRTPSAPVQRPGAVLGAETSRLGRGVLGLGSGLQKAGRRPSVWGRLGSAFGWRMQDPTPSLAQEHLPLPHPHHSHHHHGQHQQHQHRYAATRPHTAYLSGEQGLGSRGATTTSSNHHCDGTSIIDPKIEALLRRGVGPSTSGGFVAMPGSSSIHASRAAGARNSECEGSQGRRHEGRHEGGHVHDCGVGSGSSAGQGCGVVGGGVDMDMDMGCILDADVEEEGFSMSACEPDQAPKPSQGQLPPQGKSQEQPFLRMRTSNSDGSLCYMARSPPSAVTTFQDADKDLQSSDSSAQASFQAPTLLSKQVTLQVHNRSMGDSEANGLRTFTLSAYSELPAFDRTASASLATNGTASIPLATNASASASLATNRTASILLATNASASASNPSPSRAAASHSCASSGTGSYYSVNAGSALDRSSGSLGADSLCSVMSSSRTASVASAATGAVAAAADSTATESGNAATPTASISAPALVPASATASVAASVPAAVPASATASVPAPVPASAISSSPSSAAGLKGESAARTAGQSAAPVPASSSSSSPAGGLEGDSATRSAGQSKAVPWSSPFAAAATPTGYCSTLAGGSGRQYADSYKSRHKRCPSHGNLSSMECTSKDPARTGAPADSPMGSEGKDGAAAQASSAGPLHRGSMPDGRKDTGTFSPRWPRPEVSEGDTAQAAKIAGEPYRLRAVGHSLGGMALLIHTVMRARASQPSHVHRLVLLTPAGFHLEYPRATAPFLYILGPLVWLLTKVFGPKFAMPVYIPTVMARLLVFKLFADVRAIPSVAELQRLILSVLLNGDPSQWDRAMQMPHYSEVSMPAMSVHLMLHMAQLAKTRRFQLFDYGSSAANSEHYDGLSAPPDVAAAYGKLKDNGIVVDLVAGKKDGIISPVNVQAHREAMEDAGVTVSYKEFDFGHLDFTFGVKEDLKMHLMRLLRK